MKIVDAVIAKDVLNEIEDNIFYSYRYIFKKKDQKYLTIKVVEDLWEGHEALVKAIVNDPEIITCIREFVCLTGISLSGFVESVKSDSEKLVVEKKGDSHNSQRRKKNEKV